MYKRQNLIEKQLAYHKQSSLWTAYDMLIAFRLGYTGLVQTFPEIEYALRPADYLRQEGGDPPNLKSIFEPNGNRAKRAIGILVVPAAFLLAELVAHSIVGKYHHDFNQEDRTAEMAGKIAQIAASNAESLVKLQALHQRHMKIVEYMVAYVSARQTNDIWSQTEYETQIETHPDIREETRYLPRRAVSYTHLTLPTTSRV